MMSDYIDLLTRSLPLLVQGVWMTLEVFLGAAFLSFFIGLLCGTLSCNRLRQSVLSPLIEAVAFVYRGVPFFIQLLIVYFVLPDLLGFNLDPFPASVIALGLCSSGYVTQIVRGGLNAIPVSQWEAASGLGYSKIQALWHIILPQMVRNALPTFCNELDSLLKSTAIVSSIGLLELTRATMNLVSREMEPVPIYLTVALFYLFLSAILNALARIIERKLSYVAN